MVVKKVKAFDDSQEGIMLATGQDGSTFAFAMVPSVEIAWKRGEDKCND